MSKLPPDLTKIRRMIDQKDTELYKVLSQRTDLIVEIGNIKKQMQKEHNAPKISLRPAREAQILRRMLDKKSTPIPASMVISIWREMIAAACAIQSDFTVGYWGETQPDNARDMMRYYFGHTANIKRYTHTDILMKDLAQKKVNIAVMPTPDLTSGKDQEWWLDIPKPIFVAGTFPFVLNDPALAVSGEYYLLGDVPIEPTGDDSFVIKVHSQSNISRMSIVTFLSKIGFEGKSLAIYDDFQTGNRQHLLEVKGYVAPDMVKTFNQKIIEISKNTIFSSDILGQYPSPFDLLSLQENEPPQDKNISADIS